MLRNGDTLTSGWASRTVAYVACRSCQAVEWWKGLPVLEVMAGLAHVPRLIMTNLQSELV